MLKKKRLREKGKISLSRYFQELKKGDKVSVVRELSVKAGFPRRMQGKTGIVEGKRGRCYIVKIKQGMEKEFTIPAIHLKKLK